MSRTNIVYTRNTDSIVWHWKKDCSYYPVSNNIEAMVFTGEIPLIELCPECIAKDVIYRTAALAMQDLIKNKNHP